MSGLIIAVSLLGLALFLGVQVVRGFEDDACF